MTDDFMYVLYSGKIGDLASSWKLAKFNSSSNISAIYTLFLDTLLAIICMALRKYL